MIGVAWATSSSNRVVSVESIDDDQHVTTAEVEEDQPLVLSIEGAEPPVLRAIGWSQEERPRDAVAGARRGVGRREADVDPLAGVAVDGDRRRGVRRRQGREALHVADEAVHGAGHPGLRRTVARRATDGRRRHRVEVDFVQGPVGVPVGSFGRVVGLGGQGEPGRPIHRVGPPIGHGELDGPQPRLPGLARLDLRIDVLCLVGPGLQRPPAAGIHVRAIHAVPVADDADLAGGASVASRSR